jgi:hypothetical protein
LILLIANLRKMTFPTASTSRLDLYWQTHFKLDPKILLNTNAVHLAVCAESFDSPFALSLSKGER